MNEAETRADHIDPALAAAGWGACEKAPCPKCGQRPCVCRKKTKVALADGKSRHIQHMVVTGFWHPDGTPMSAPQFMEALFGRLPDFFGDEDELRTLWSAPDTRRKRFWISCFRTMWPSASRNWTRRS